MFVPCRFQSHLSRYSPVCKISQKEVLPHRTNGFCSAFQNVHAIYIYVPQKKRPKNVLVFVRTPSGRALLPDLRETAKAELHSVESMEDPRTTWEQRGMEKCGGEMVCVVKPWMIVKSSSSIRKSGGFTVKMRGWTEVLGGSSQPILACFITFIEVIT
jgi:hypothetical protein